MEPLISIIIPTYQREKKLKFALDSVFSQTYKNWEIIVIDNNSNDGSEEMIKSYKSDKILFKTISNNGNIAKSRNLGIELSKGDHLAFLDSDDFWKKNKLEEAIKFLNQGYKLVYHDMYIMKKYNQVFFKKTGYCRNLKDDIWTDLIFNGPAFSTSGIIIEKKIFQEISNFDINEDVITWEDYDAWIRLSKITSKFKKINKTLGYLWSGNENTLKPQKLIKNIFFFKKRYLNNHKELPNWCRLALMKSYYYVGDFEKSLEIIKEIDFINQKYLNKIKIIIFFILIKLKKIFI